MRVDVIFPTTDRILSTSANTTVRFDAGSVRLHSGKTSKIELYYAKGHDRVPGSYPENPTPNTLIGTDYNNGVTIDDEGLALFKVKPNSLSSQHSHQEFRFKITVYPDNIFMYSEPFKTVTKLSRKRPLDEYKVDESELLSDTSLSEVADAMVADAMGELVPSDIYTLEPDISLRRIYSLLEKIEARQEKIDSQQQALLDTLEQTKTCQASLRTTLDETKELQHSVKMDAQEAVRLLHAAVIFRYF